ncbi:MAG TPA: MFS transporter [Acidimicrobiales bacterium]|nr:MFS transporter [Acidimicrobiales bacterium]
MGGHGNIHTPPGDSQKINEWSIPTSEKSPATPPSPPLDVDTDVLALSGDPARWKIFTIVGFALFMSSLDLTIVGTALPAIHRSLHSPINWTAWTITAATLGTVVIMPIAGGISDQYGRKRVFIASAALFTVASLACGFAGNIYLLVILRALQALGGGAFMPSATGIVADSFGPNRDRAIAMFTSILPAGAIAGPVLGGAFVTYWSWRGIFFINVPIGIAVIAFAVHYLPKSSRRHAENLDYYGIFLLGSTVLVAMYAVALLGEQHPGIGSPKIIGVLITACLLALAFARNTLRNPNPIVPLYLLKGRAFLVMDLVNLIYGAAVLGLGALVPLYAEDRFHIAPLQAGTVLAARARDHRRRRHFLILAAENRFSSADDRRHDHHCPRKRDDVLQTFGNRTIRLALADDRSHRDWHGSGNAGGEQRDPLVCLRRHCRNHGHARHVPLDRLDRRGLGHDGNRLAQFPSWSHSWMGIRAHRSSDHHSHPTHRISGRPPGELVGRSEAVQG